MTHAEIDALPAGREMDLLIAVRFLGKEDVGPREHHQWGLDANGEIDMNSWQTDEGEHGPFCPRCDSMGPTWGDALDSVCDVGLEHYSTDIAAAWLVIEHFGSYTVNSTHFKDKLHVCDLTSAPGAKVGQWGRGWGPTAPLAICRAALKAVG